MPGVRGGCTAGTPWPAGASKGAGTVSAPAGGVGVAGGATGAGVLAGGCPWPNKAPDIINSRIIIPLLFRRLKRLPNSHQIHEQLLNPHVDPRLRWGQPEALNVGDERRI